MLRVNAKKLHVDTSERRCGVNMTRCEERTYEGGKAGKGCERGARV